MSSKILIIGLDGADSQILDQGSADGSLPNLASLRGRGRIQRLSRMPGLTDDALWASFQYGVELGEHGRSLFWLDDDDGRLDKAYWLEEDRAAFWDVLSEQGARIALIDVPKCPNPRPINGIHLADWLVHGRYFPRPRSFPGSLAGDVKRRFGTAPCSRCDRRRYGARDEEFDDIVANLRTSIAMKRDCGLHYLASENWDLFVIGFKEAHCANHGFFDLDSRHPEFNPLARKRLGNPIVDVLEGLDRAVGDLVRAAGPAAEVLVFSLTEFGANGSADHLMPAIVGRLNGLLAAQEHEAAQSLPQGCTALAEPDPKDLSADFCCSILPYNENCAALRVRFRERRRHEVSANDRRRFDLTLDQLEMHLGALCDAGTGKPVVSGISRPSSEFAGSRSHQLPDLLLHWECGRFPHAVASPALGKIEGQAPLMRPGNHVAGGLAIGAGRSVEEGLANVRTVADLGALAMTATLRAV